MKNSVLIAKEQSEESQSKKRKRDKKVGNKTVELPLQEVPLLIEPTFAKSKKKKEYRATTWLDDLYMCVQQAFDQCERERVDDGEVPYDEDTVLKLKASLYSVALEFALVGSVALNKKTLTAWSSVRAELQTLILTGDKSTYEGPKNIDVAEVLLASCSAASPVEQEVPSEPLFPPELRMHNLLSASGHHFASKAASGKLAAATRRQPWYRSFQEKLLDAIEEKFCVTTSDSVSVDAILGVIFEHLQKIIGEHFPDGCLDSFMLIMGSH
jgi:hypothetical protein